MLFGSKANRTLRLLAAFAVAAACGKSASKDGSRAPSSDAGENTAGDAGDPGPGGADTGGTSQGGESSGGAMSGAGRGGAPTAGQGGSRAGSPSGGSSGAGGSLGGAKNPATPDGCTLTTHLLGGLYCSMEMRCGSDTVLISCQEDGRDWRCGCVRGGVRPDFLYFPDMTGIRTCEVSAVACMHPELLDADEVCTLTDDATSTYSCTATDTCVREHQVEGVTLETRSEWTASCEACPMSSDACCSCKEGHFPDYRLVARDIEDGCLYLDELCRRSDDVTLGAGSCVTLGESTDDISCSVDMRCEYPLGLTDGTTLILPKTFQTHCTEYAYPEPVTHCQCTDEDLWDTLNVRVDPGPPDITRCRNTSQACAGIASLVPTGDLDCTEYAEPTSPSDRFCRRQRSCLQPATLLGTAVQTVSGALVDCNERDDGSWFCNCFFALKGEEPVTIEPDAGDSEGACAQAIAECPLVSRAVY